MKKVNVNTQDVTSIVNSEAAETAAFFNASQLGTALTTALAAASLVTSGEDLTKELIGEVSEAKKRLKQARLSKEEYKTLYKEAFVKAVGVLKAELELSKEFNALPVFPGFRSDTYKLKGKEDAPITKTKILEVEYGLQYKQAWEIQQLTEYWYRKTIKAAFKKGTLPTRGLALRLINKCKNGKKSAIKAKEKATLAIKNFAAVHSAEAKTLTGDKYDVIYANPPYEGEVADKSLALSFEQIKDIEIPAADNAILFLWMPLNNLTEGLDIMKRWGFSECTHAIWDYEESTPSSLCFETCHRVLLVATKGDEAFEAQMKKDSVLRLRKNGTDNKPNYYYQVIERMFPGKTFLDVFSPKAFNSTWSVLFNNSNEEK